MDPFHVALSRLLHLDGLLSALVGLAALVWLNYLFRGRRRADLIVAGVVVGLAGLTRTLAVVLLPMILLSAFIEAPAANVRSQALWRLLWDRLKPAVVVGVAALITFIALWPAMWTSPIATTRDFIEVGFELGQKAHERPIFFDGEIYNGVDPGAWFYPASFIWRTTPAMLVGMVLSALVLLLGLRRRDRSVQYRPALYLLALAVTILLVLDLSDKKLDRYIIPIVPPLAFISGWGFGEVGRLASRIAAKRNSRLPDEFLVGLTSALLIAVNVVEIAQGHPYDLSYFNPLLGGAPAARSVIMVGWGEGLDQIAESIEQQPEASEQRFVTSTWKTPISYFLDDITVGAYDFRDPGALESWLRSDYYVWYVTPELRGYIPPEMQAYFDGLEPVTMVRLGGLNFAALYDLRGQPLPAFFLAQAWMTEIAPELQLVTATVSPPTTLPGSNVTAVFYLTGAPASDAEFKVQLTLTAPDGSQLVGKTQSLPSGAGEAEWSVRRRIELPADAALGTYWVTGRFTSATTSVDVVLGSVSVVNEVIPTPTPVIEDELEEADG
jgi:hypothetical protein